MAVERLVIGGIVKNGVVMPEGNAKLPEGTRVEIIVPTEDMPPELPPVPEKAKDPDALMIRGGSAIIAPDGRYLAGPVFDEETVVVADCDLAEITRESLTLDVSGHYSRPDVFEFRVRPRRPADG